MLVNGYSDLAISTPDCHADAQTWVARFKLDTDVQDLFPYINAVTESPIYYENPHYIQFTLDGFRCALYPDNATAASFIDRNQAMNFIQHLIDFLNDLYAKKDSIEPNHKKYKYVSVLEVFKLLPQTNCRKCGYPSCMAFANALSKGETIVDVCPDLMVTNSANADKLQSVLL